MRTTNDVIDSHLRCFAQRDLDGILSDYDPGAILFTPDGPLRGREEIRSLFVDLLEEFGKPGARFSLQQRSVAGDCAYIVWTAETADRRFELGTDTFLVRDGRIAVQSFAASTTPRP